VQTKPSTRHAEKTTTIGIPTERTSTVNPTVRHTSGPSTSTQPPKGGSTPGELTPTPDVPTTEKDVTANHPPIQTHGYTKTSGVSSTQHVETSKFKVCLKRILNC
jgi:hypothetical protein